MQNLMQVYSEQGAHARQKHQRLGAIWQVQEIAMQNKSDKTGKDKCKWGPWWVRAWDSSCIQSKCMGLLPLQIHSWSNHSLAPASLQTATKVSTSEIRFRSCKHFFTNINDAVGTFFYACFPIVDKTHSKWLPMNLHKGIKVSSMFNSNKMHT